MTNGKRTSVRKGFSAHKVQVQVYAKSCILNVYCYVYVMQTNYIDAEFSYFQNSLDRKFNPQKWTYPFVVSKVV